MKIFSNKKLAALVAITMLAATNSAAAVDKHQIYYNGKTVAELHILTDTDVVGSGLYEKDQTYFDMTAESALATGITSATAYWTNMLGAGNKSPQPWAIAVVGLNNYKNAVASPKNYNVEGEYQPINYIKEAIQNGKVLCNVEDFTQSPIAWEDGDTAFSFIQIGRYFGAEREGATSGYWVDTDTLLPTNEQSADFLGCFRHELGHALGILAEYDVYVEDKENTLLGKDEIPLLCYSQTNDWNSHLIDQNGNALDRAKLVITSEQFATLKADDSSLEEADFFIVDYVPQDNSTVGKPYFVGENVTEALGGKTFDGVSGLPVNGWEGRDGNYTFEGSHLQTTGMMSHRSYSNYTTFMEVELAAMQDIGYRLDRRAYYGKSIYADSQTITNTQGYSARNADGTAYLAGEYSTVPLGVGLHIYGSDNTVTQAADILTNGTGSAGVRVDGTGNALTVAQLRLSLRMARTAVASWSPTAAVTR